jgi:glutathione S-transferase
MQVPVLYSFRRCPYAIRARLALYASGITIEIREIALRNKPESMLLTSPKGTVPVLLLPNGQVIDESWSIMQWALHQHDPQNWLGIDNGYLNAAAKLVLQNDSDFKNNLDRYKYPERYPEQIQHDYRAQGEVFLQQLEKHLANNRYLLGDNFSIADAALLPFIRQFSSVDKEWFASTPYPQLRHWLEYFLNSELFNAIMQKHPLWLAKA